MEAGWDASGSNAVINDAFFDFLNEELLLGGEALDAGTLAAASGAAEASAGAGTHGLIGRKRSANTRDDVDDLDDEDDDDASQGRGGGKRGKAAGQTAAVNKASREKARREKINDRYAARGRLQQLRL